MPFGRISNFLSFAQRAIHLIKSNMTSSNHICNILRIYLFIHIFVCLFLKWRWILYLLNPTSWMKLVSVATRQRLYLENRKHKTIRNVTGFRSQRRNDITDIKMTAVRHDFDRISIKQCKIPLAVFFSQKSLTNNTTVKI